MCGNFIDYTIDRNFRPELLFKKYILKSFVKLTKKHLFQCLFLSKVAGLGNFVKKRDYGASFCELYEIFRNTYFAERLWGRFMFESIDNPSKMQQRKFQFP